MVATELKTSRRVLLGALVATPAAAISAASQTADGFLQSPVGSTSELPALRRSREGRSLSRVRHHNAEGFLRSLPVGLDRSMADTLYVAGIVAQLGLSSHLLDVGFDDQWCARNIGLNVARSLSYANATGLGFESADFELLAAILSPYNEWRDPYPRSADPDVPFAIDTIQDLLRSLLDRVREVTGHPRLRGRRNVLGATAS